MFSKYTPSGGCALNIQPGGNQGYFVQDEYYYLDITDTRDKLFTYVRLDPDHMPTAIMLQWLIGGDGEHRAYWGANNFGEGTDDTNSRRFGGDLPEPGVWTRLEVTADHVGLEGATVDGMSFLTFDGRATYDRSGKQHIATETVYVEDDIPTGATVISSDTDTDDEGGDDDATYTVVENGDGTVRVWFGPLDNTKPVLLDAATFNAALLDSLNAEDA